MSVSVKLTINDLALSNVTVLKCEYRFHRHTSPNGKPEGIVRNEFLHLQLNSDDKTGLFRQISQATGKDHSVARPFSGELVFTKINGDGNFRTIRFSNASVIHFKEVFNKASGEEDDRTKQRSNTVYDVRISFQHMRIGADLYSAEWPVDQAQQATV